jgi:hypothetical protein
MTRKSGYRFSEKVMLKHGMTQKSGYEFTKIVMAGHSRSKKGVGCAWDRPSLRHGRACPGHPRSFFQSSEAKDVDARHKAGHDGGARAVGADYVRQ